MKITEVLRDIIIIIGNLQHYTHVVPFALSRILNGSYGGSFSLPPLAGRPPPQLFDDEIVYNTAVLPLVE